MEFGETATRREIVKGIAEQAGVTHELANYVYQSFLDVVHAKLKEGKKVILPNIGVFHFVKKEKSFSNLTKQEIPPHTQIKFKLNVKLARYIRVMSRE